MIHASVFYFYQYQTRYMKRILLTLSSCLALVAVHGQFTHADSLRGALRPERTAFDMTYYDLSVEVDIPRKSIKGYNMLHFRVTDRTVSRLQVDLFSNLNVTAVTGEKGEALKYTRDGNAIFVQLSPDTATRRFIRVDYEGIPTAAVNPPWDGGFVWSKDKRGNPWVGVACEGIGASLWWPNKDHLSDETDSMKISVTCPTGLEAVCNGNLRNKVPMGDKTRFEWFVSYPINNYNVTLNIGKYVHLHDQYKGIEYPFDLDYYVLDYNQDKARLHFRQVKPMMECYEAKIGPYPFPRDGFALVETPYLGMEHQGAIAYGNDYLPGYAGFDYSFLNLDFDYIIIHEAGHEYWGNSVSMKDVADMWIHEGFCTYSEAIYVECKHGADTALLYCNSWKYRVANDKPVIGRYDVNKEGSTDMYYKGALMLHTLRWLVADDALWWQTIAGIQKDFYLKTTTTREIVAYMNTKLGNDYTWFFDQYLKYSSPPVLDYKLKRKGNDLEVTYKWTAVEPSFKLPVKFRTGADTWTTVNPTLKPQKITVRNMDPADFLVDEKHAYFLIQYE